MAEGGEAQNQPGAEAEPAGSAGVRLAAGDADLAGAIEPLAAEAARLAPEADRERRLSDGLVKAMADAGVFRMLVPAAVGGIEAHPATFVATVETLARGDGATGWCAAIGATSGLLAGYLPEESAREIYGPPGTISGGVFAPRGKAIPAEGGAAAGEGGTVAGEGGTAAGAGGASEGAGGATEGATAGAAAAAWPAEGRTAAAEGDGFRVSGRWPFASGCNHCHWLMGGCLVEGDVIMMLAPADEVVIHDTWHPMGLRGTGSHDIEMRDVYVPKEHSAALVTGTPTAAGPLYAFPLFGLLAIAIGAVNLGIARGALDDVTNLANARKPTGSSRTMAERATVQAAVAEATSRLDAAQALLYGTIAKAWEQATGGAVPTEHRAALRRAATHAATTGADVVTTAFKLAGGAAVYETNTPLPRRFRDAHTATQHMLVAPATNELTGRLLLGLETDTRQL